jgi:hypothetical protein
MLMSEDLPTLERPITANLRSIIGIITISASGGGSGSAASGAPRRDAGWPQGSAWVRTLGTSWDGRPPG